jgi:hypothetical protein
MEPHEMTPQYVGLALFIVFLGVMGLVVIALRGHLQRIREEGFTSGSGKNWALFKRFDIVGDEGMLYLRRYRIIETPWFRVFLHFIKTEDKDQDPHDHPWNFRSLVLRGGYTEMVYENPWRGLLVNAHFPGENPVLGDVSVAIRKPRSFHLMPTRSAHRILSVKPNTITLVFAGKRTRSWGFFSADFGFMDWREYMVKYPQKQSPDQDKSLFTDYPVVDGQDARMCRCGHIAQTHVHFDSHRSYCGACSCNGFILKVGA